MIATSISATSICATSISATSISGTSISALLTTTLVRLFALPLVASLLLAAACGASHGLGDGGGPVADAGSTADGGAPTDAGTGDVCGATTCAVGEQCCMACGGMFCAAGEGPCPTIPSCPFIVRSCEEALTASSGLPCAFEGGCATVGDCCSASAECVDGLTVVSSRCAPGCGMGVCNSSAECAPDQYCQLSALCTPDSGTCVPRPDGCFTDCPGACGCDGRFYCNACDANAVGVSVIDDAGSSDPTTCGPPPPTSDCRGTGCPAGTTCERCWDAFACLAPGTDC